MLLILCAGQFLMTLDSSVMNVSIAQVASDLGTTVTGIQTAITLYTLVMATLMITGGKIGSMIGRRKAFAIGCVIYACGSVTTALAPNLTVLIIGWSFLEGIGAALIMPAIVALVASNFAAAERPRAYGLVASAGAIAVAAGPLIGGAVTTLWTWRLVFAGEVVLVAVILLFTRKIKDAPAESGIKLDVVGVVLSAAGLGMAVFGVLRSGEWGWVQAKPDAPALLGISMTVWLVLGGLWCCGSSSGGSSAGPRPARSRWSTWRCCKSPRLRGGLTMFFFQFLLQAGLFFTIPLFLSVALGLSAFETGVRLLPLSVALLAAAVGIPKFWPKASPATRGQRGARRAARRHRLADPGPRRRARGPRSSRSRCSSPASASARCPRSWARSRSRRSPTSSAARSAACRTPAPTSAPRWAPPWPGRC